MRNVLLVEDDLVLRDAYKMILGHTPHKLYVARDGMEALKVCKKTSFDLILLDLMMPHLDGVGFLKQANLKVSSPHTKVIIFSNLSSGSEVDEARSLGVYKMLLKADIEPTQLLKEVDNALKK